jgi:hypothetical protein
VPQASDTDPPNEEIANKDLRPVRADSAASEVDWLRIANTELGRSIVEARYGHILQQIQGVNENVFRFLAIYQTLISALAGGQVLLFINHQHWVLSQSTTKIGLVGLLILETIVGIFTALMITVGALSWFDYRSEECSISDVVLGAGFRKRPSAANWYRWYETYIVAFVFLSLVALWLLVVVWMIPAVS